MPQEVCLYYVKRTRLYEIEKFQDIPEHVRSSSEGVDIIVQNL